MEKQRPQGPRPVLGKGLASLFPNSSATLGSVPPPPPAVSGDVDISNKERHPGISLCSIDEIVPNEYQPRKIFDDSSIAELSTSIKANGLIQPLIVRKTGAPGYQLIAGERRWRAARLAGLKQVPIVIRRTTDKEALELALIENIQREDLNCMDTASAYYQLVHDFDLKQEELSDRVGKDRTSITNHLRLLKLPVAVQEALKDKRLTFGHGRALAGVEDQTLLEKLASEALEKKWSVRELENQIQKIKNLQTGKASNNTPDGSAGFDPLRLRLRNLGRDLSNKYSTRVQLRGNETRGKIVMEYHSPEDLERLLGNLMESKN